jgi:hypothetical protein
MNHTITELRALARAYLDAHPKIGPTTLSRRINGAQHSRAGSEKFITRLLAGHSCLMEQGERASAWFHENWPPDAPWPDDVPRCREVAK